jgi:hypothetical protein
MRIDGAGRRLEFRFRRVGMKGNVAGGHRHAEISMLVIPGRAGGANPESINAVVSGLIFAREFL